MVNFFNDSNLVDGESILDDIKNNKAQLIDIRENVEWDQGHFQCALHIPLSQLAQGSGINALKELKNNNKKIYLHCLSGSRVGVAKRMLAGFGCDDISIIPFAMSKMSGMGFKFVHQ